MVYQERLAEARERGWIAQDYFLPCCGGWHHAHVRAPIGSLLHWIYERLRLLAD
jgi:hypothetical protein